MKKGNKEGKRSFLNRKKGQVRGIDFALAMLIFIIAFSQVIIVLTHLLVPSIMQMENYAESQELDKLYSLVFNSAGEPTNWAKIGTTELTDFKLGLKDTNNQLSFSKINRLVPEIADYWKIDYMFVKSSYSLLKDFVIGIESPLSLEIDGFTAGFGQITITGKVYNHETPVEYVDISTFAIDQNNDVSVNSTVTQSISGSISFESSLSVAVSQYYTIVVFAQLNNVYETYTVFRIYRSETSIDYELVDFDLHPFAYENSEKTSSSVDVHVQRPTISTSAEAIILFPVSDIDVTYHSQVLTAENSNTEGNIYVGTDIPIPTEGFAVVVVQETDGVNYRAGYIGLPMFLTQEDSSLFGYTGIFSEEGYVSSSTLLYVRNRLVRCQMWLG
ncbi:MAG: hypothetical protein ACTSQE_03070 [Candidatus Heimdallarchaeaceae archaeon]